MKSRFLSVPHCMFVYSGQGNVETIPIYDTKTIKHLQNIVSTICYATERSWQVSRELL